METVFAEFDLIHPQTKEEHDRFLNELEPHNNDHLATDVDLKDAVELISNNFDN